MGHADVCLIDAADQAERPYPREGNAEAGQIMAWAMATPHAGPFAEVAATMAEWPCIAHDDWHRDVMRALLCGDMAAFQRASAEAQAEAAELLMLVPTVPGDL